MKIALCTTTIHVPHALKLMRKCSDNVKFFVAVEKESTNEFRQQILAIADGVVLEGNGSTKCSQAIGWNTLARRNIAFLEALRWGADAIVSWDTDNYPLDLDYFRDFEQILECPFHGVEVAGKDHWFDGGAYLRPPAKNRGFPIQHQHRPVYKPVTDRKAGVASGMILNDPDVDSMTRIVQAPDSQQVSMLADAGMIVDLHTWTVFNTQSTAVIRELMPAWFLLPNVGRMDDIYASLVVQRVARDRGYHVHFGKPFAIQQRHEHDLVKDLRAEIDGYDGVVKLAKFLDSLILPGKSVIEDTCIIYSALRYCDFLPTASVDAALLWIEDVESVL